VEIIAESKYRLVIPRHGRMRVPGVVRHTLADPGPGRCAGCGLPRWSGYEQTSQYACRTGPAGGAPSSARGDGRQRVSARRDAAPGLARKPRCSDLLEAP
jgi:hypothetical protein